MKPLGAPKGSGNALDALTFDSSRFDIYEMPSGDVFVTHKADTLGHKNNPDAIIRIGSAAVLRVEYFSIEESPLGKFLAAPPDGPGDAPEPKRGPGRPPKQIVPPLL